MTHLEQALHEFVDSLETASDEMAFRSVAERLVQCVGFRWFAYLGFAEHGFRVVSSYPASWARRYLERGYERADPVLVEAKTSCRAFAWDYILATKRTPAERRLMWEASQFGIRSGITVPIRGGFGRFAAFTVAADNTDCSASLFPNHMMEFLQLAAFYYHVHVYAKLQLKFHESGDVSLTQRERQCLWWTARGKKMPEAAAILGVSTRTVTFHLENARAKLGSATIAQAVAEAMRRRLILP